MEVQMAHPPKYPIMDGINPAIDQGIIHGWRVSWNPDDDRYYIHDMPEIAVGVSTHKYFRNVIQWCRVHPK